VVDVVIKIVQNIYIRKESSTKIGADAKEKRNCANSGDQKVSEWNKEVETLNVFYSPFHL